MPMRKSITADQQGDHSVVMKQKRNLCRFFLSPLAAQAVILVTSLFFARSATAAYEGATFEYRLVFSNDDKVCKHMEKVYNKHFRRWEFSDYFKKRLDFQNMTKEERFRFKTRFSFYPTSPEFDAVRWQTHEYMAGTKRLRPILVTDLDINNDGEKEIVIKRQHFNGGPDSFEELLVYNKGQFDLDTVPSARVLSQGQPGKEKPRVIGWGNMGIIRPFIFDGQTFLSIYTYYVPPPPNKAEPGIPPHWMWVKKYRGGGKVWPGEETPLLLDDICKFDMPRINN
jgi:hypothetical protein